VKHQEWQLFYAIGTAGVMKMTQSPIGLPLTPVVYIFTLTIYHSLGLLPQLICFTNPFLHSLSGSGWTALRDLEPVPDLVGTGVCLF